MGWRVIRTSLVIAALLAIPVRGFAQDATLTGSVKDSSGAVLPGVTVTALHEATGNTFVAVTDEVGGFRLLIRTGAYRITVELPGFATVTRSINLLLGQNAVVNLEMAPSSVQESVTVTGEAPLIETTSSSLSGNIDPVQMQELPLNGRNWMDLAMLAPGSRQNASSGAPLLRQGMSQINIDGQQVTNNYIGLGDDQPRFSRDSIAEFELLTNRFDATQGRSAGMIANAITKSGTNMFSGSIGGYFRDDSLNAADHVQKRVLPYSNQQISTTFGGPIRRDRLHFFGNYEYEREPQVLVFSAAGPLSVFNMNIPAPRKQYAWGTKLDLQMSSEIRFSARVNAYEQNFYSGGGAAFHPSTSQWQQRYTRQGFGTMTWVINNRAVNMIRGGYSTFHRNNGPLTLTSGGTNPFMSVLHDGAPMRVTFRGYAVGAVAQHHNQDLTSIRDDLSISFSKGGRHDVKMGGEYIYNLANLVGCGSLCSPRIIAQNGAPTSIDMQAAFPVWDDAATWNLNLLAPLAQRYETSVTNVPGFYRDLPQSNFAGWIQDDWTVSSKLTLNLGMRYDLQTGIGTDLDLRPFLPGEHANDTNNFGPRVGFAYSVNDRTVIRGGYGRFFSQGTADEAHQTVLFIIGVSPTVSYDGRADWPTNPWNGAEPTFDQVMANACDLTGNRPGCLRRQFLPEINSPYYQMTNSHQASIGIQRQFGRAMAFESNVVYTGGRNEEYTENINLSYNPATGANYPSSDVSRRPLPQFGPVQLALFEGRSNYYGWENSFTKRMTDRWQATITYTLGQMKDAIGNPYAWSVVNNSLSRSALDFPLATDIGADYTLAATDQRHRAVFSGIYEAPLGFQLSGVYFYGSGQRFLTTYGGDLRDQVAGTETNRLRPNGTVVPRNNLVGEPIHRFDMRLQKRFQLARLSIDGMAEVFNVFNHANYGNYTNQESNASYGRPVFSSNISYQPRVLQLGFRVQF